jgi:hypothetical protein
VLCFFDSCSNLKQLFLYNFKNLNDHFPDILIAKFKHFLYFIRLFDIISKNIVKFPPSCAYLYARICMTMAPPIDTVPGSVLRLRLL